MTSLSTLLSGRRDEEPVFRCSRSVTSAAELLRRARDLQNTTFAPLANRVATLRCCDIENYLQSLVALDGWAAAVLLVEDSIDMALLEEFETQLSCSHRVTATKDDCIIECLGVKCKQTQACTRWVIPTSGTTGKPKLIAHTLQSLTRSVKPPTDRLRRIRWGLIYDPTRFAGIQVMLQAIAGDSTLLAPNTGIPFDETVSFLADHGCNALSATPSLWRKLAYSGALSKLDLDIVTLGGEASDQKILDRLKAEFPKATIRHIYASTEAGVGFSVADCKAGFPIDYLHAPPPGVELSVRDDGMLLLRTAGYEQRLNEGDQSMDDQGWVVTGDLLEIQGDRCYFQGRANGAINVGGNKVQPATVERVIADIPGVMAVRVFGKSSPIVGSLVMADVVAEQGYDEKELKRRITEQCRKQLNPYETPAILSFRQDLELTTAGKIAR